MDFLDHSVLYSDEAFSSDWKKLVRQSHKAREHSVRRKARKKMRKAVKELLNNVRPASFFREEGV